MFTPGMIIASLP
ncbi:hypothetical protein D020_2247A, partial [Vibrio parahaemolyticus SBR10290]